MSIGCVDCGGEVLAGQSAANDFPLCGGCARVYREHCETERATAVAMGADCPDCGVDLCDSCWDRFEEEAEASALDWWT